jgi:hypothetical protein
LRSRSQHPVDLAPQSLPKKRNSVSPLQIGPPLSS